MDKNVKYELGDEIEEDLGDIENLEEEVETDLGVTIEEQRAKVELINLKIKKLLKERDEIEREIEDLKEDMEEDVE